MVQWRGVKRGGAFWFDLEDGGASRAVEGNGDGTSRGFLRQFIASR